MNRPAPRKWSKSVRLRPAGGGGVNCGAGRGLLVDKQNYRSPSHRATILIVTSRDQPTQVAETIAARMAVYLGPHTARIAVKTFTQRALGRGPDSLELPDVPELLAALRPMLRTLVGHSQCEIVLQRIERELGL
jgi:hypothetical protein